MEELGGNDLVGRIAFRSAQLDILALDFLHFVGLQDSERRILELLLDLLEPAHLGQRRIEFD